jgi:hypothetical protein
MRGRTDVVPTPAAWPPVGVDGVVELAGVEDTDGVKGADPEEEEPAPSATARAQVYVYDGETDERSDTRSIAKPDDPCRSVPAAAPMTSGPVLSNCQRMSWRCPQQPLAPAYGQSRLPLPGPSSYIHIWYAAGMFGMPPAQFAVQPVHPDERGEGSAS